MPAGRYEEAFDTTREVLREFQFDLERVDAASGVVSTKPHFSQGILQPWDPTQSGFDQEWEDAANMQAREVRVTFAPAAAAPPTDAGDPAAPVPDMRESPEELVGTVWVTIHRQQRAGRRLDSEWGGSTFYYDLELGARAGHRYLVPLRRDERLESRLAARIRERLGSPAPAQQIQ